MEGLLDSSRFSVESGAMLAGLAIMSEHGNSPIAIDTLSGPMQRMVAMLLDLSDDERASSGISLWGPIGDDGRREYIGVRAPINSLGYAVFDSEPISQLQ